MTHETCAWCAAVIPHGEGCRTTLDRKHSGTFEFLPEGAIALAFCTPRCQEGMRALMREYSDTRDIAV